MSGIEVVGLVLGVIPILVEGLDIYKSGVRSIRKGFRRRLEVDKLARKLREHAAFLEEILRSILLHAGCDPPEDLIVNAGQLWKDPATESAVSAFLGKHYTVLTQSIQECEEVLCQLIQKLVRLVPGITTNVDVVEILKANDAICARSDEFAARILFVLSRKDFEEESQQLENSLRSLMRLAQVVASNSQLAVEQPARKAKRLARTLWTIRQQADDVYLAMARIWLGKCHHKHEALLFLEDRVEQSRQSRDSQGGSDTHYFKMIFSGTSSQAIDCWHETRVNITTAEHHEPYNDPNPRSNANLRPSVRIDVPSVSNPVAMEDVKDICATIKHGKAKQQHTTFALMQECKMAVETSQRNAYSPCNPKAAVPLKNILSGGSRSTNYSRGFSLPARISLALNIASSFLQVLQTPWSAPQLSTDVVTVLQASNKDPDTTKPLLLLSFDTSALPRPSSQTVVFDWRPAVVELGIILLEIWHCTTFEEQRATGNASLRPIERRMHALEWFEEDPSTFLGSYRGAIHYCLSGAMSSTSKSTAWDDMGLWASICENVIEPLAKLSKA